ncbi:GntR family transcriptional regulator [Methylobrevis albus]|uniref:GntR family transcriptional regulator n=1 Tax=Methylobrevis albus TaxID=2793297 RepID=A0A931N158_9HYPH|nr:GntR family transcriptional regulator [Methylobrevis albus]MBH0239486.1 GntR family transcriptional regulator [Methylobrevis albus]
MLQFDVPKSSDRLDRRRSVVGQIFDVLRAEIIALQLAPGSAISRSALAERFGVSLTPIREALLRLEQQGLVEVYPQSGTLVSLIDVRQAHQSQFLRIAVEMEVSERIASNPSAYDLSEVGAIHDEMVSIWRKTTEPRAIRSPDQSFHAAMCDAVGQRELWDLVVARSGNIDRMRSIHIYPGKVEQILREHGNLLDALRAGDVAGARATMRLHLSGTLRAIDELKATYPHYFLA